MNLCEEKETKYLIFGLLLASAGFANAQQNINPYPTCECGPKVTKVCSIQANGILYNLVVTIYDSNGRSVGSHRVLSNVSMETAMRFLNTNACY